MVHEIIGTETMVSMFKDNGKRKIILGTVGLIGAGAAYMAYKLVNSNKEIAAR